MEKNDQEWIEKSMKWEGLTTRNRQSGRHIFFMRLFVTLFLLLFFCGLLVYLIDPFFHYHKPWFHLKEVLNEKEYQCPGSLAHFDYDAVLAGSSVVENNDNSWFNQDFHCTIIKAVRSYGATADLCDLLDRVSPPEGKTGFLQSGSLRPTCRAGAYLCQQRCSDVSL